MVSKSLRLGDPIPRPQIERMDLDAISHTAFWCLVLREFDGWSSSLNSRILYYNKSSVPQKGCTP